MNSVNQNIDSFVNVFDENSLAILNKVKNILKTQKNIRVIVSEMNTQQKADLLTFIFSLSSENVKQESSSANQKGDGIDLAQIRSSLVQFEKMKVPELKAYCKEHNLKTSGTKWELINRIQISQINFEKFDNSSIDEFKTWAGLFMSVVWNSGSLCNCESVDQYNKMQNETLLEFISRIEEDKSLYFTEDAIIEEVLEERGASFNEDDSCWRFADSEIQPKEAILAWILGFDKATTSRKRRSNEISVSDSDSEYKNSESEDESGDESYNESEDERSSESGDESYNESVDERSHELYIQMLKQERENIEEFKRKFWYQEN